MSRVEKIDVILEKRISLAEKLETVEESLKELCLRFSKLEQMGD